MKKLILFSFAILLLTAALALSALAEGVVYLDGGIAAAGDGSAPQTAVKTLAAAVKALPSGGTIVVCGDTPVPEVQLANTSGLITVTSVYEDTDYDADLILNGILVLSGPYTFEHINIHNNSTAKGFEIFARGYTLTMESTVTCTSAGGELCYPVLYGGKRMAAHNTDTHLIVRGGTWRCIIGGNYSKAFTANSLIDFTGGRVLYAVAGGNYLDNFTGNSTINIGGDAVVEHNSLSGIVGGVIGATMGDGSNAYSFTGNIAINIGGNAKIYSNVFGVSRRDKVNVGGDIAIDIFGSAELYRHVYGGGYMGNAATGAGGISVTIRQNAAQYPAADVSLPYLCAGPQQGTVTGNLHVLVKDNAYVGGSVCGAGYKGTVIGDSTAEITGGTVNNNFTAGAAMGTLDGNAYALACGGAIGTTASTANDVRGNGGYTNDTLKGVVTGTSSILLDGSTVAGDVMLGGATGTVTLKSGSANSAPDPLSIDLSDGGNLSVGGAINATAVTGGGRLTLSSAGRLTAAELFGTLTVDINGKVWPGTTYVTVTDVTSDGSVVYGGGDAVFTQTSDASGICYTVNGDYLTTAVTVTYYNPDPEATQPRIVIYRVGETNTKVTSGITYDTDHAGRRTASVSLAPGLYYYKVYFGDGGSDFQQKYFYISGKCASMNFDHPITPYEPNAYMENVSYYMTDEIIENYFSMGAYPRLDTPGFTLHGNDSRTFTSNAEICAYLDGLAANCDYMHVYYPFPLSAGGNRYPVVVFTKDTIPQDATFDEVGAIVRGGGIREILMVSGGVHGLEPSGVESQLVYAKALAGAYGESLFADAKFGAVVIIPCVSLDNYQRLSYKYPYDETLPYAEGINPQRNLMALQREGTQNQVYVYKTFMPTVYIDNHEDYSTIRIDPTDRSISYTENGSLSNFEDVAVRYSPLQNSPLVDIGTVIGGATPAADQIGMDMQMEAIGQLSDMGLRAGVYFLGNTMPNTSWPYAKARGSYGFLIEVMRIHSGKTRFERAVFAQSEALKALTDAVASRAGELAQNVCDGRAAAVVTAFDPDNLFAKKTTYTGRTYFTFPRLTVYIDGTVKDTVTIKMGQADTVSDFVAMPTAYVIPKDETHIEQILRLLDMHGIRYTEIRPGSTLTLRKYGGLDTVNTANEAVTIGAAAPVTFEDGAYVVTTDCSDSYLVAYLFEPDSMPFTSFDESTHSLTNMLYLTGDDALYRSEVDGMAELIADMAVQPAPAGDADGNGIITLLDALTAARAILNGEDLPAADANGDGRLTLSDVLRIIILCAAQTV
ncbi:MAG: hypothetical protein IJU41_08295 [Clostridia bacterium]|nr:hypothetical protein [Clostridia bacterium]